MMDNNQTPVFIERNPDAIMAESKTMMEGLLGRELQPAQVEQLILQFIVYREVLLLERFNAGMSQLLFQFSKAPVLDYLAGLVAVERLPSAHAGCTVRFTLVEGHGHVLIPEGTRVATGDSVAVFATVDDITVAPEINSIEISVLAETPGKDCNDYVPGTIIKILDPLAFVATVTNLDTTGGGSDVETDEQLRERMKLAPSQFSTAGSRASYEYHAKSANSSITYVSISSPVPGSVLIVPLTKTGEISQQLINDIYQTCNPEHVRPLTDTVIVSAPVRKEYAIEVNVTLYDDSDAAKAQEEITSVLNDFIKEKRERLGLDIVCSHISQACRISPVYDVAVVLPATNLVVDDEEFADCTDIAINIVGFNHG